ncbi:MAG: hypothetical protein IPM29_10420 [Planctomycetes bacterium]|nr:hypothetical protein [Planctomycetota bacterium]
MNHLRIAFCTTVLAIASPLVSQSGTTSLRGFVVSPIGGATVSVDPATGELVVAGSGTHGVDIEFGDSRWTPAFRMPVDDGDTVDLTKRGTVDGVIGRNAGELRLSVSGNRLLATPDFGALMASHYDIVLLHDDVTVAQYSGIPMNQPIIVDQRMDGRFWCWLRHPFNAEKRYNCNHPTSGCPTWSIAFDDDTDVEVNGVPMVADGFLVYPTGSATTVESIERITVRAAGSGPFRLAAAQVESGAARLAGVGDVALTMGAGGLTARLPNVQTDGGVHADIGRAQCAILRLDGLPSVARMAPGARLSVSGTVRTASGVASSGSVLFQRSAAAELDISASTGGVVHYEVHNAGTVVHSGTATTSIGSVDALPAAFYTDPSHGRWPWFRWFGARFVTPATFRVGGSTVIGDELRFRTGPDDALSFESLELVARGVNGLTVTSADTIQLFGEGCPGSAGTVPMLYAGNAPRLGASMALHLQDAAPGAVALMGIGLSRFEVRGIPLPFELGVLGAPGCALLTSLDADFPLVVDASGSAQLDLVMPSDPVLAGLPLYFQSVVIDPPANAAAITTSNGVATSIGS